LRRFFIATLSLVLISLLSAYSFAQNKKPQPSPTPPVDSKSEDQLKVFTEEVRLPVSAKDTYGHYDPTLEIEDVLVLEDGVAQQIRSVRHIPANVLLVVDTGGDSNGLGGGSKKTSTTRDVALRIVTQLKEGDRIAVLQSSNQAELLQAWTTDVVSVRRILQTKLFATKRSRIFETMTRAAQLLSDQPEGSRNVILITDGVESPGGKIAVNEAIKQLVSVRATVHIISYTELVRQKDTKQPSNVTAGMRPPSSDPISANDPTLPPGSTRSPSYGVAIRFDPAMTKVRKAYEAETRKAERWLTDLAEETGGQIFLPATTAEMIAKGDEVARDIGAEYIVTYRPTRPLVEAKPGEYRKIEVAARRVGLYLRSRKGYVVPQ
jgi:VWFA-related protein